MQIPKEVIEKAVAGGWKWSSNGLSYIYYGWGIADDELFDEKRFEEIALDPLFWQALGKVLGWGVYDRAMQEAAEDPDWMLIAHRFYYLILTDTPTDIFWADLLAN